MDNMFGVNQNAQPNYGNGSFMTILVNGESGANAYPVAAGNTVLLIDFNEKKFWIKTTDVNRIPQPLRSFKFDEITPAPKVEAPSVSREEFESLNKKLDQLIADLGGK